MENKIKTINILSLATTRQQRAKMKMRHSHKYSESHEECEQLIWNSLSFALRPSPTLPAFKVIFKTYLFKHDSDQQQVFSAAQIVNCLSFALCSVQFSSRWYPCAQKSPHALHPVSQKMSPMSPLKWFQCSSDQRLALSRPVK